MGFLHGGRHKCFSFRKTIVLDSQGLRLNQAKLTKAAKSLLQEGSQGLLFSAKALPLKKILPLELRKVILKTVPPN